MPARDATGAGVGRAAAAGATAGKGATACSDSDTTAGRAGVVARAAGEGVASPPADETGGGAGLDGWGAAGFGAVISPGAAVGGAGRRCGTREPPNTPLEAPRGVEAVVTAGREVGLGGSTPEASVLGAEVRGVGTTGGASPAPRGKGPARKTV